MFTRSFKLMTLLGFDVKIDLSWFLIAALITWSLATGYFPFVVPEGSIAAYVMMALAAMLLFFGSLLLHELAHAVVARRFGMKIKGITLFLFGGVAELGAEPETAKIELWVALAGPAMSFVLAALFWFSGLIALRLEVPEPASAIFGYLALINLVLALFNLLPAFPLDGGRVLRALLWKRHGNLLEATRVASMSGTVLAWALIGFGLFSVISGASLGGIWQVLIGLFLLGAAKNAYRQQLLATTVTHQTVGDLMSRTVVTVRPEQTLMSLVHDTVLKHRFSFVPVVDEDRLLGYIDLDTAMLTDQEDWHKTRVEEVFIAADESNTARPNMTAEALIERMGRSKRRKYLVTDGKRLLGVISMSDLINYLALTRQVSEVTGTSGSKSLSGRGRRA